MTKVKTLGHGQDTLRRRKEESKRWWLIGKTLEHIAKGSMVEGNVGR